MIIRSSRNSRRNGSSERAIGAPDLEPAAGDRLVVIVVRLGSPADSASGRPLEHLLRHLAVVTQPAIQVFGEAVPQEGKNATRVQGQHRAEDRGVPEREADADAPMAPPALHGSPSRRTNPTPRTVWMSFVATS